MSCTSDITGRFWLIGKSGRSQTQVKFCPFCGEQSNNVSPIETISDFTSPEEAMPGKDRPQRVWRNYARNRRPNMIHFLFGQVAVLATDGCHSRVLDSNNQQITVCNENLEEPYKSDAKVVIKEQKAREPRTRNTSNFSDLLKKFGLSED